MNFWEFADRSPILVGLPIILTILLIRSAVKRICRAACIRKQGWPPRHCDADGDFQTADDDEPNAKLRDAVTPNSNKENNL